jgi:hypothetical protein
MSQYDLPPVTLVQQSNAKPHTGEELEVLGKQAAQRYLTGDSNLTSAVVETVKKAGLSPEQVKRVVEFANTHAYLTEFRKEGAHHVVEFDGGPADASVILKDLNDGGGGTVFDRGDGDYNMPPPGTSKTASRNEDRLGIENTKLAEAFGVGEVHLPYAEPLQESYELRDKLASAYDVCSSELSALETVFMDVCDNLYNEVKQASLNGTPLGHLLAAWQPVTSNAENIKLAFQMLTPRLIERGIFPSREAMSDSFMQTKVAGIVNEKHPLVVHYVDFCDCLEKMAHLREASDELAANLDTMNTFLKHAVSRVAQLAGQALGKGVAAVPKAVGAVTRGAAKLAPEVETALGGGKAGRLAGTAVKYAPHAVGALVAEDMYQRAKYNPAGRAAKNFVMSRVPYTAENQMRQYQMQMGG